MSRRLLSLSCVVLSLSCAALSLCACSVGSVQEAASLVAMNQCNSNAECSVNSDCEAHQCVSHEGTLTSVLFEITRTSSTASNVQFLKLATLKATGGDLALDLDSVAPSLGYVTIAKRDCVPEFDFATPKDLSIPAVLTLTPSTSVLGLYSPRTVVESVLVKDVKFGFTLDAPPGTYDIYVAPKHQPNNDCPVPPALLRGQPFSGGSLSIELPQPSTFELHVTWPPADGALSGWTVDMLDPRSGLVLSNRVPLTLAAGSKTDYVALLYYLPVVSKTAEPAAQELVRLSPPANLTAPTVLLARSALGLFAPNEGRLTLLNSLPSSVHIQARVTEPGTPKPAAATVTLVATQIAGLDPGLLASFVRTVNVSSTGEFQTDLLPGTYRVSAVPNTELNADPSAAAESKLSAVSLEWVVGSTPSVQAGRVIELGSALPITGEAYSGSTALAASQVSAVPSPASIQTDVLQQSLGESSPIPRASNGFVAAEGDFALNADPGQFDIAIRPLANTGFGWLVLPNVPVGTVLLTSSGAMLGRQQAAPPIRYRGAVSLPGTPNRVPVTGALIRAYVYMSAGQYTDDASKADSVLQVAETRTDDGGNFDAYIPAALNSWEPTVAP